MSADYRPRFSFEITEEQQKRCFKLLNVYGLKKTIFSYILDDFLDLLEKHGPVVVGLILDHHTKVKDILPSMKRVELKCEEMKDGSE